MKRHLISVSGLILFGLLCASTRQAIPQTMSSGGTIQVHLKYSGSGTVDDNHKIYVALWDTPSFVEHDAMPIEVKSATSKNGTVTFSDVKKVPAYVSAAFDLNGQWDGNSGPPPKGASLGLYSKSPGKPAPIDVSGGKKASVEIPFDDSVKMPDK